MISLKYGTFFCYTSKKDSDDDKKGNTNNNALSYSGMTPYLSTYQSPTSSKTDLEEVNFTSLKFDPKSCEKMIA